MAGYLKQANQPSNAGFGQGVNQFVGSQNAYAAQGSGLENYNYSIPSDAFYSAQSLIMQQ